MSELLRSLNRAKSGLEALAGMVNLVSPQAAVYVLEAATKISAAIQQVKQDQKKELERA